MTKISIGLGAVLALAGAGCSHKQAGPDCGAAIANSMQLSKATMAKMPGFDDKLGARMRDVGVTRCTADKWPAEAITCMTNAQTEGDAQSCYGKLTADQSAKMNKAAMELMQPTPGAGGNAATTPR